MADSKDCLLCQLGQALGKQDNLSSRAHCNLTITADTHILVKLHLLGRGGKKGPGWQKEQLYKGAGEAQCSDWRELTGCWSVGGMWGEMVTENEGGMRL